MHMWQEAVKVAQGAGAGDRMSALAEHVLGQRRCAKKLSDPTSVVCDLIINVVLTRVGRQHHDHRLKQLSCSLT